MMEKPNLPKWAAKLVNPIIDEINRTKLIRGDGVFIDETPSGEILSVSPLSKGSRKKKKKPATPKAGTWWITVDYFFVLEGQTSAEGFTQPSPDFNNPLAYFPFNLPLSSYQCTFLNNVFQPIGTDGSLTVSDHGISKLTVTSVPDPFAFPPGQRIYSFNWERTFAIGPLKPITDRNGVNVGNVQQGRFYFDTIPDGALYVVVGTPGNNIFGQASLNLGQSTIHTPLDLLTFGATV